MSSPAPNSIPAPSLPQTLQKWGLALLGFSLLAVPLFFATDTQDQFELPKQLLLRALLGLMLGLVAMAALTQPWSWRRFPLHKPILAWGLWLLICTVFSLSPPLSWRGEYENFAGALTQLSYILAFVLALQWARETAQARRLLGWVQTAALGAAFYALLQAQQRDLIHWSASTVINARFFGTLGNPNFLGGLLAMAIPLKLALAWSERHETKDKDADLRLGVLLLWVLAYFAQAQGQALLLFPLKEGASLSSAVVTILWVLSLPLAFLLRRQGKPLAAQALAQGADLALLFQALANTGTRGAFLGLMAGSAWLWFGRPKNAEGSKKGYKTWVSLGLALFLLVTAFAGLGTSFRERMVESLKAPYASLQRSRLTIWLPALQMWKDHPVKGTGVDTFKAVFPQYALSEFNRFDGDNVSSRNAHCEPLQILATQGTVGLLLWLWLLFTAGRVWFKRLGQTQDPAHRTLLQGLGGLLVAYLVQNLVSFGVAGISLPFWVGLGLLGAGTPLPEKTLASPRLGLGLALVLAGSLTTGWLYLDWQTLKADLAYALANQAEKEVKVMEKAGPEEARTAARLVLTELLGGRPLAGEVKAEAQLWASALQQLDQAPPSQDSLMGYRRAAACLLLTLAVHNLEDSVRRCPGEVKYWVFLGLCYEDLVQWSLPGRRPVWFQAARERYFHTTQLNPRNAYYEGNLGRLHSLGIQGPTDEFFQNAEMHYLKAVSLGPSTRLFQENLLLLYTRFGKLAEADAMLARNRVRDPELAQELSIAAATTFYQSSRDHGSAWAPQDRANALPQVLAWTRQAIALKPDNPEYYMVLALLEFDVRNRAEAQKAVDQALKLRPDFKEALDFKSEKRL